MILGTDRVIKLNAALSYYRGSFSEFQRMASALLELDITLFALKNIVIEVWSDYKLCELLYMCICKEALATQKLNAHRCKELTN
jgi:hypothetical protein